MDFKMFFENYEKEIKNINFKIPWKLIPTHRKIIIMIYIVELISIVTLTILDYLYKSRYSSILINNMFNFSIMGLIKKFYEIKISVILIKKIIRVILISVQFLIIISLKKGNIKKRLLIGAVANFIIFLIEVIYGCFFPLLLEKFIYTYIYLEFFIWSIIFIWVENTEENKKVMNYYTQKNSYKRKKILINLLDKYKIGINDKNNLKFIITIKNRRVLSNFTFFITKIKEIFKMNWIPVSSILMIILNLKITEYYKEYGLMPFILLFIIFIYVSISIYSIKTLFSKQDYFTEDLEEIIIFNNFFTKIFEKKSKENYS